MLGIQEELLRETPFYKDIFEENRQVGWEKGKAEGEVKGKLANVSLLRRLGLSDEQIAKELGLSLNAAQNVPKTSGGQETRWRDPLSPALLYSRIPSVA